jgi:hypothetical protein
VIVILRWVGLLNAAVWFGASLVFTFVIAPAFFSPDLRQILGEQGTNYVYSGRLAAVVQARYFVLQHWCGAIAILHFLAEWVYLGKPMQKLSIGLLLSMFGLGLIGDLWMQPKIMELHRAKYSLQSSPDQKAQAAKSLRAWHGSAALTNLLVLGALAAYFVRINQSDSDNGTRFVRANTFSPGPGNFRG